MTTVLGWRSPIVRPRPLTMNGGAVGRQVLLCLLLGVKVPRSLEELYPPSGAKVIHLVTTPSQFSSHQNPRIPVITFMLLVKRFRKYPVARLCCGQPPPFILLESLPLLSMSEWSCRRVCSRTKRGRGVPPRDPVSQTVSPPLRASLPPSSLFTVPLSSVRPYRPSSVRPRGAQSPSRSLARPFFRATDRGCTSSSSSFTAIHIQITGFVEKLAYHRRT